MTKCAIKRKEQNLPLSDESVPVGDDSVFWEKSWKVRIKKFRNSCFYEIFQPELWIRHNHDSPDDSDMIVSEPPKPNPKEMSEQERIIRQNMRHQKFGKLAKLLAKRFPNDEISSKFSQVSVL